MTDEDYDVELDFPPEWTEEEIRGIKRFTNLMLQHAHQSERSSAYNLIVRAALHGGMDIFQLKLPRKPKPLRKNVSRTPRRA